ncbi:MAG: Na/Pi cotransporter family protein [Hyphomicrobiales bacterium]|nr:Na/Pi cotransporter family protein [Hyphomicrobiales bacterium]
MAVLPFLLSIAAATVLLLYAVRLVQTGIDRAFGASFRRLVTGSAFPPYIAFVGAVLAVLMQSSAAVAVIVSEFAAAGAIGTATGLAAVLGADFGSAIVVQLLSLPIAWLMPLLVASGGLLFLKTQSNNARQAGRILLGLGLVLLSLRLLREAVGPIQDGSLLPSIVGYLESDPISAFLLGSALAFVMHSSVAVILMCVALVSIGTIPFFAGLALVLGANLGSALIPMWLARDKGRESFRILLANLLLRGSMALIALLVLQFFYPVERLEPAQSATYLLIAHLAFNGLLLVFVPFGRPIAKGLRALVPDGVEEAPNALGSTSVLDFGLTRDPQQAAINLKREVLRMGHLVEEQVRPIMYLYEQGSSAAIDALGKRDKVVNQTLSGIRRFVIELKEADADQTLREEIGSLVEYAIKLEAAADVIAKRMVPLARKKKKQSIKFSKEGWEELVNIHDHIMVNMGLALNVLLSEDLETARRLIEERSELSKRERHSRKHHLTRLQTGSEASIESSNLHLETLTALKDINSQITSIAYPILYRAGQLLDSRLVQLDD